MIKIAFIAPYVDMKGVIEQVFNEHPNKDAIIPEIFFAESKELNSIEFNCDIIISRGLTASTAKKSGMLCVELQVTGYDVISAVNECKELYNPKKIAIIGTHNMVYGAKAIGKIFDCEIVCWKIEKSHNIQESIIQASKDGAEAIIGGLYVSKLAREMGSNSVLIKSGKESISAAIDEAIRAVEIARQESEKSERVKAILDYSFEGIIATDEIGKVILANKQVQELFNISPTKLVSKKLCETIDTINITDTIDSGKKLLGELIRHKENVIAYNSVPVMTNRGISGAVVTLQNATKIQELERQLRKKLFAKGFVAKYTFNDIIGKDKVTLNAKNIAMKISGADSNVLIYGETGTGKELFAQSIHNSSNRKNGPFVAINCGALPENLLESELFGYADGAFTGAAKGGKPGLFELAHNGTIFLDEIGDISLKLQVRLLRVIQEREIMRLGHDRVIPVNVRIISASHKELKEEVKNGNFRRDLFYRLNVLKLTIPPLRKRKKDIIELVEHFLDAERLKHNVVVKDIEKDALKILKDYPWPGNIREINNFCERLCVLCENEVATVEDIVSILELNDECYDNDYEVEKENLFPDLIRNSEREIILEALRKVSFNKTEASKLLSIDKSTLWRKMKKYNIK